MDRKLLLLGLVIIIILTLLCSQKNYVNEFFPSNYQDPYWKNRRFFKKTLDNQLLATAPVHILEKFEQNSKNNESRKQIGNSIDSFLSGTTSGISNNENTQADLNSSLTTKQLLEQNKQKLHNLNLLTENVHKKTQHASTVPKLNAKFQKQGPILPERKGFEYQLMKEGKCKFFSGDQCPSDYPVFTGANIGLSGINGINLSCNGVANVDKAKAIAVVNEYGQIEKVHIVNKGKGYKTTPKVNIIGGGGYGCKTNAVLDDRGSLQFIDIISSGEGYTSTPSVEFGNPDGSNNCQLCCQPDLFH